jgi:DNA-binding MarR family transcriptional regulator
VDTSLLEQFTRLRVMVLLYRHRDLAARRIRDDLGLTDGNLASHAGRLEAAGWLETRNALGRRGFEVRHRITPAGSAAVQEHLARLRRLLEEV